MDQINEERNIISKPATVTRPRLILRRGVSDVSKGNFCGLLEAGFVQMGGISAFNHGEITVKFFG